MVGFRTPSDGNCINRANHAAVGTLFTINILPCLILLLLEHYPHLIINI